MISCFIKTSQITRSHLFLLKQTRNFHTSFQILENTNNLPTKKPVVETRQHILRDQARAKAFQKSIREVTKGIKDDLNKGFLQLNEEFIKLNLLPSIVRAVEDAGYQTPTDIQRRAIPTAIRGMNIVGSAQTGTGKTAAYVLPLLHRLHIMLKGEEKEITLGTMKKRQCAPLALILCPSVELAEQVMGKVTQYAKYMDNIRIVGIYGAMQSKETQIAELSKGLDVLVSTPGRLYTLIRNRKELIPTKSNSTAGKKTKKDVEEEADEYDEYYDESMKADDDDDVEFNEDETIYPEEEDEDELTNSKEKKNRSKADKKSSKNNTSSSIIKIIEDGEGIIDLSKVKIFVLDEVDRMLDLGHAADIKKIFLNLPRPQKGKNRAEDRMQVMMYSATLMGKIHTLVYRYAPYHEKIDLNWDLKVPETVRQVTYFVEYRRKRALLFYLLRRRGSLKEKKVLVFCRTSVRVRNLAQSLIEEGFSANCIYRSQDTDVRMRNIEDFRKNQLQILVSTDLMSRGIDIPDIDCVINFDVPHITEEYIHRIGRTGRIGKDGQAITFVSKSPIVVSVSNRVVGIDEKEYLRNIEKLLEKRIPTSKVPGPWRDESKSGNPDESEIKKKEEAKEKVRKLLGKQQRIVDNTERMKNKKRMTDIERQATTIIKKKNHSLRDFPEGRYEWVINKLEETQSRKKGLALPNNFQQQAKEFEEVRQQKREIKRLKENMRTVKHNNNNNKSRSNNTNKSKK
eukprot:TRINITY_DN12184_c0_g1_i1.p1 TRINITY_DN12184_c0_g1~~TRINITY_DN12184_c0_g1_i1.p1  ORF type:complete len:738 (-),score=182.79 TRINITY_DN12184_c0_g1_i1:23-2236(-)